MAWAPISLIVPQYVDLNGDPYSGAVLKAYAAGTSTNIAMATDSSGGTTFTSISLNSEGYPEHSGAVVIPHIDQTYKLALYANQTAADADSSPKWIPDNLAPVSASGNFIVGDSAADTVLEIATLTRTTTATPANGIGARQSWKVETTDDNIETGMVIDAVVTDVTASSEDFKAVLGLMSGGTLSSVMQVTPSVLSPFASDGMALGSTSLMWSDAFLASGAVVNFDNGDVTLTHSANTLTMAGGNFVFAGLAGSAGGATITRFLDEDDMSSDADDAGATQQSIKAYILARGKDLVLDERTSNTILGVSDSGHFVNITSGTFTQTFEATATLGTNWVCYYKNSGTGDITIDPDSSEQIDGLTSFVMYPGEARLIQCDGSKFTSILLEGFKRTFTSSGTFTTPPGYSAFSGLLWSAGGSGRAVTSGGSAAAGGGGGGCFPFTLESSLFGTTESITIGAGGAAVAYTNNGNAGGNSSIGSLLTVYGGAAGTGSDASGGSIGPSSAISATGATAGFNSSSDGSATLYGGVGSDVTAAAGDTVYGGAAGGSVDSGGTAQDAGTSLVGGDGGASSNGGGGTNGTAPGGGGGATKNTSTLSSGAGARGELRIWGIV